MPFYSRVFSIRTIIFLVIAVASIGYSSLLLWSGAGIIKTLVEQYTTEIITTKIDGIIHEANIRYAQLERFNQEITPQRHIDIKNTIREDLSILRYRETGTYFVIDLEKNIDLSADFKNNYGTDFDAFFRSLSQQGSVFQFTVAGTKKFCINKFYPPWNGFIGVTIDEKELFLPRNVFIKIVLLLLLAVVLGAILFSGLIQRLILTPIINISTYANQVSKGNYDGQLSGKYILELGTLKVDIQQMVANQKHRMDQTKAQLQLITERERWLDEALRALQESEKKYRTIYNAPNDAIIIYDPVADRIVDANKGMALLFGYQIDETTALSICDLSAGEAPYSPNEFSDHLSLALESDSHYFEWLCRNKENDIFWVDITLQPTYIEGKKYLLAVIRNIHARKMAQESLSSEKERLAVTLKSIGDGVITTDKRGRVRIMNKVAENLTGWKQHEAAGRLFKEVFHIVHQKNRQQCENPVEKILGTGEIIDLASDTILIAKDGSEKVIADSGAPIRDPQSAVIGAVIVFRDITEEKRMEEELFKVKKLESVGVLAGGIAHDFNNILVGILGNISLVRQYLDDKNKTDEMLRNTEKAALRAKDLTAQLLTFSRGGEPIIKTTSIASTIRESAEFALRGSNVKINLNIPNDLWLVYADSGQISQVIQNIVLNSRQAIPEEGTVEISCFNCTDCDCGNKELQQKCVRIVISDNGPGISQESQAKIFDPYFTTKEDGSGLGLAICHSIIMKHKGEISVESKPGAGTTFTIQLPVSEKQKIDHRGEVPLHSLSKQEARILVMDDDEMILQLSQQMLEYLGHVVVTCNDGEQALALYEKNLEEQTPFDLVILDLTIPGGMGGEKTISKLLEIDPNAKAIVSSGYSNDKVMAEHMQHGFKAMVVKPYQIEDIDKAIQETLTS